MPGDVFITTAEHEQLQSQLVCDTLRHAWDLVDSNWVPMFGTPVTLRCMRCGTERRDTIDNRGDVSSRRYVKPPGWAKYPKGTRPTHAEFRLMLISQRVKEARALRVIREGTATA